MASRIRLIINALKKAYPDAECELDFSGAFQLLIATILSAQCTDKKVNLVTPALFKKYPDARRLAAAKLDEVERLIHSLGLFRNKAKSIVACALTLHEKFGGEVPATIEELITLPGVGRKTANCVLVNAYGKPGIMADTHCIRLSNRLELVRGLDAVKIEMGLKKLVPVREQALFSHALILHGRRICHARTPECDHCSLCRYCPYPAQATLPRAQT